MITINQFVYLINLSYFSLLQFRINTATDTLDNQKSFFSIFHIRNTNFSNLTISQLQNSIFLEILSTLFHLSVLNQPILCSSAVTFIHFFSENWKRKSFDKNLSFKLL